jgi:hypothetical protein
LTSLGAAELRVGRRAVVLLGQLRVAAGAVVAALAAVMLLVGWLLGNPVARAWAPAGRPCRR